MDEPDGKAWLAGVFDRAAPTYDSVVGAYHDRFGERLVEAARVGPGDAVLDVACGRGAVLEPALAAAGPTGRVVGVDLSPEMVRRARQRLGSSVELHVMDAERLDLEPGSFTRVLCGFGVFFLPDPEAAVRGFRRLLADGGVVGVSTWGAEDRRWDWEGELLADVDVEHRAVRRPFDEPDDLRGLLVGAGFEGVDVHAVASEVHLADAAEWWVWVWSYSLRGILEQLPPARLDRFRQEAEGHLAALETDAGIPLRLEALVATGRA